MPAGSDPFFTNASAPAVSAPASTQTLEERLKSLATAAHEARQRGDKAAADAATAEFQRLQATAQGQAAWAKVQAERQAQNAANVVPSKGPGGISLGDVGRAAVRYATPVGVLAGGIDLATGTDLSGALGDLVTGNTQGVKDRVQSVVQNPGGAIRQVTRNADPVSVGLRVRDAISGGNASGAYDNVIAGGINTAARAVTGAPIQGPGIVDAAKDVVAGAVPPIPGITAPTAAAPGATGGQAAAPGQQYQVGAPIDVSGALGQSQQAVAGGQALVDQATQGAGQAGANLSQAGQERVGAFEQDAATLLSNQTQAIQSLYGDAFSQLDDIETDPTALYERALAQQLAAASATPGGAAAVRGAQFQAAQQAPALMSQANADITQNKLQRSQLFNQLTQSMSADQLAVMQGGLAASNTALQALQQYDITGEQLDSSERMWLGNLGRDLQNIWQANAQAWAGLSQQEKLARLENEARRYGIDRQFDGIMAGIQAGNTPNFRDYSNLVLGLLGAVI